MFPNPGFDVGKAWAGVAPATTSTTTATITIATPTDTDDDGSKGDFLFIFDRLDIYATGSD